MVDYFGPAGDHWAYFGDGNAAQIIDSKDFIKKKTGQRYVKFIFKPSKLIQETYDLSERQDPTSNLVIMEYPATHVVFLQRGTHRTRCWVFTDFIGRSTVASRRHEDINEALMDTERLLRGAQAAKNRAYAELEREQQQQMLSLKTKTDMVRQVRRASQRLETDDGEGGYDQEDGG